MLGSQILERSLERGIFSRTRPIRVKTYNRGGHTRKASYTGGVW